MNALTDECTLRRAFLSQARWVRHLESDGAFLRLLVLEMRRRFLLGLGDVTSVVNFDRGGQVLTLGDDGTETTILGNGRITTWRIDDLGPQLVTERVVRRAVLS
jgi:hypothetical protein